MRTEEQKKKYNENRKRKLEEQKKARDNEKASGTPGRKRLAFVRNLIKLKGTNLVTIAKKIGMTQQALTWIFNIQDDCYITVLKKILDALGIECTISLLKPGQAEEAKEPEESIFSFSGNIQIGPERKDMPEYITGCPPKANMRFLAEFISDNYKNVGEFVKAAGTNHTSLKGFFLHDNIKLSILCSYAEKLGIKIHFDLNEKKG